MSYLKTNKIDNPVNSDDRIKILPLKVAKYFWDIVQDHVVRGNGHTGVASKIEYLLYEPITQNGKNSLTASIHFDIILPHHAEESDIETLWNLESLGKRLPQHDDEEGFTKRYQQIHREFNQNQTNLCELERT